MPPVNRNHAAATLKAVRNPAVRRFITHVMRATRRGGCDLVMHATQRLDARTDAGNGAFVIIDGRAELHIATGGRQRLWLPILVHEFMHYKQWRRGAPEFNAVVGGRDPLLVLLAWINGMQMPARTVWRCVAAVQACELDAERRALRTIRQYGLPIDCDRYVRGAAAYLYFYTWAAIRRRWYTALRAPYVNTGILKLVPARLAHIDFTAIPARVLCGFDRLAGRRRT